MLCHGQCQILGCTDRSVNESFVRGDSTALLDSSLSDPARTATHRSTVSSSWQLASLGWNGLQSAQQCLGYELHLLVSVDAW